VRGFTYDFATGRSRTIPMKADLSCSAPREARHLAAGRASVAPTEIAWSPTRPPCRGREHQSPAVPRMDRSDTRVWNRGIRISKALFRREEEYGWTWWVVKYASRRSRIGDFSGDSSVRGARIRGVLASHANAGQRGLSAQGVEPDGRGCRFGVRPLRGGRMTVSVIGVAPGRASRDG